MFTSSSVLFPLRHFFCCLTACFDVCFLSLMIMSFVSFVFFFNIKVDFHPSLVSCWEPNSRMSAGRVLASWSAVSWIHLPKFRNRNIGPDRFTKKKNPAFPKTFRSRTRSRPVSLSVCTKKYDIAQTKPFSIVFNIWYQSGNLNHLVKPKREFVASLNTKCFLVVICRLQQHIHIGGRIDCLLSFFAVSFGDTGFKHF